MRLRATTRFPKRVRAPVQRLTVASITALSPRNQSRTSVKSRDIKQSPIVGEKLTFPGSYFQVRSSTSFQLHADTSPHVEAMALWSPKLRIYLNVYITYLR